MRLRQHIPNLLTFARMAAVPACLWFIFSSPTDSAGVLLGIFIAASLTDFWDGYLARRWNATSTLGALLDPIADKLLVALMLIYWVGQEHISYWCDNQSPEQIPLMGAKLLPVAVILLRELYISGLREFLAARQIALPVSRAGKWKTALQMIAIASLLAALVYPTPIPADGDCLIADGGLGDGLFALGFLLLYIAAILAFTSAVAYTRAAWRSMR